MIKLEGFEIEEMRSMNHILTVELQFLTAVTQKEASEYLKNLLENANGTLENANDNPEIVNEVPETANEELEIAEQVNPDAEKAKKPKKEKDKPGPKRTKIDWDKACALKKAGWSNDEIAAEIHAPVGTINSMIYQRLKEYNAGKRSERCEEIEHE